MPSHHSLRRVLPLLVGMGLSASLPAEVTVAPSTVPVGKASAITVTPEQAGTLRSVSLQPASPWQVTRIPLAGLHPDYQVLQRHNGLYLRDADNRVVAFFANARGHVNSANYDFVAAGTDGVQIYKEHDWRHTQAVASYRTSTPALDVDISAGLAFVAGGRGGLTLLDVENPEQPLWLGSHQKLGRVVKVSSQGCQAAVLNDADTVYLVDADNPAEPTAISAWRSDTPLRDIARHGDHVFALTDEAILVIDFGVEPPLISNQGLDFGQGVNLGGERRVYVDNALAYVADWFSGIHIYDLSRPRQPELLASFHTPGSPKGIVVRNGVAFVADDDHGLQIIDVSDPQRPQQISALLTRGLAYTPRLVGDLLYLASHRGGFQIIDVSDVSSPQLIGEFDTPGKAWSLEIHGDIAYVADDDSGLLLFDVSDPGAPAPIGQYFTGAAAEEVTVDGELAYVAFFDDGLHVVDISDPRRPQAVARLALPGNARGLARVGDTLYVAGWLAGVHVLDISDPRHPRLLGSHDTRGASWGVEAVDERHLYVMDWWGGVSVLDVSNPRRPQAVGGYHQRGRVHGIAARANYSYVAHGSNGLQVFDIKNPLNPTWTTGVSFPGQARQVTLVGSRAYVAAGDGGLAIVDITDPFNIRWLGSVATRGEAERLASDGQHLFLSDSREGLIALDLDQTPPRRLDRLPVQARDLWLDKDTLYLATASGIEVVRLNPEGRFEQIADLALPDGARHIQGDEQLLYVATGDTLLSLRHPSLQQLSALDLGAEITALGRGEPGLLASTASQLLHLDHSDPARPRVVTRYPLLQPSTDLAYHQGVAYLSGAETITALRPLPLLEQGVKDKDRVELALPETLATGDYDLQLTYTDGRQTRVHNALRIVLPAFSKPSMSMEEFKRLMEQQRNNPELFTAPPNSD